MGDDGPTGPGAAPQQINNPFAASNGKKTGGAPTDPGASPQPSNPFATMFGSKGPPQEEEMPSTARLGGEVLSGAAIDASDGSARTPKISERPTMMTWSQLKCACNARRKHVLHQTDTRTYTTLQVGARETRWHRLRVE